MNSWKLEFAMLLYLHNSNYNNQSMPENIVITVCYTHYAISTCEGMFVTALVHEERKLSDLHNTDVDNNSTIAPFQ